MTLIAATGAATVSVMTCMIAAARPRQWFRSQRQVGMLSTCNAHNSSEEEAVLSMRADITFIAGVRSQPKNNYMAVKLCETGEIGVTVYTNKANI